MGHDVAANLAAMFAADTAAKTGQSERQRAAMRRAVVMIIDRFGVDLPELQAALTEAGDEAYPLSWWPQYPNGAEGRA